MTIIQAAILGLIQGLTEFLPVSSSGHLVLMQQMFGITEPVLAFDIAVHVGTLFAVCAYFSKDLIAITKGLLGSCRAWRQKKPLNSDEQKSLQITMMILVGSIPTAMIGFLFNQIAHTLYSSILVVGCMLLITGMLLWMTRRLTAAPQKSKPITWQRALGMGTAQGLAVLPGISRAGATIATALFLGLDRATAVRFSFLLSIPAIIGAALLALLDFDSTTQMDPVVMGLGLAIAAVTGYLALKWLVYMVQKGRLHQFAPYCWVVGILTLGWRFF